MNVRRMAIEKLCRSFITRQNTNIEQCRDMYKHLLRPLVTDVEYLSYSNVGEFIEIIGCQLFNHRPANMAYIMVFLEFVLHMYETMDNVSIDIFVASAANVLEKTEFIPIQRYLGLFDIFASIFINIYTFITALFY